MPVNTLNGIFHHSVKKSRRYYAALLKDYKNPNRVILQLRTVKDCLDPETWIYIGACWTTKEYLKSIPFWILKSINETYGTNFTKIIID